MKILKIQAFISNWFKFCCFFLDFVGQVQSILEISQFHTQFLFGNPVRLQFKDNIS